jgi:hypothetical protein
MAGAEEVEDTTTGMKDVAGMELMTGIKGVMNAVRREVAASHMLTTTQSAIYCSYVKNDGCSWQFVIRAARSFLFLPAQSDLYSLNICRFSLAR